MGHESCSPAVCPDVPLNFSTPGRFIATYPYHLDTALEKYRSQNSSHRFGFQQAAKILGVRMAQIEEKVLSFSFRGSEIGSLNGMRPSLVTVGAARFCRNKCATLALLRDTGVAVPVSRFFTPDAPGFDAARDYWLNTGPNVVMKPSHGSGGSGVTVGVHSEAEFKVAWEKAVGPGPKNRQVIIEDQLAGCDFRVVIVAGRAICATTRVPAFVVGDGQKSLASLVLAKNTKRTEHPYHKKSELILASHHNPTAVPGPNEIVFLNSTANIHTGGEAYDVTPYIPEEVRHLAEAAARAIPGLGVAGVDVIFGGVEPKVIEINTSPNFGMHYFPLYGASRNPAYEVLLAMIEQATTNGNNCRAEEAYAR